MKKVERYLPCSRMKNDHFIINYNEIDKICIEDILDVLEEKQLENRWIEYIKANYNFQ